MCAFHLNGHCERAEACSFAHDPSELKPKPDLQCTKLCPHMLKRGHCAKMSTCKFAHNELEVQAIDLENVVGPPPDSQSDIGHQMFVSHSHQTFVSPLPFSLQRALEQVPPDSSCEAFSTSFFATSEDSLFMASQSTTPTESSFPATPEVSPRCVDPRVISHFGNAAQAGALSLQEMVLHLTRIFMSVYQTQPDVAERTGMPASLLASSTAEQAWFDAGFHIDAKMTFNELMQWCAFPMQALMDPTAQKTKFLDDHATHGADSDACSQASTNEGTVASQSPDGTASLHSFSEDTSEARSLAQHGTTDVEITVRNTFYHFDTPSVTTTPCRARSVPSWSRNKTS